MTMTLLPVGTSSGNKWPYNFQFALLASSSRGVKPWHDEEFLEVSRSTPCNRQACFFSIQLSEEGFVSVNIDLHSKKWFFTKLASWQACTWLWLVLKGLKKDVPAKKDLKKCTWYMQVWLNEYIATSSCMWPLLEFYFTEDPQPRKLNGNWNASLHLGNNCTHLNRESSDQFDIEVGISTQELMERKVL